MSDKKNETSDTNPEVFGGKLVAYLTCCIIMGLIVFFVTNSMGRSNKSNQKQNAKSKANHMSGNYGKSAEQQSGKKTIADPNIIKTRHQIVERRSIANKIRIEKEMQIRKVEMEKEILERNQYMAPIRAAQVKDPVAEVDVVLEPINSPGAPKLIWSIDDAEIDNRK